MLLSHMLCVRLTRHLLTYLLTYSISQSFLSVAAELVVVSQRSAYDSTDFHSRRRAYDLFCTLAFAA